MEGVAEGKTYDFDERGGIVLAFQEVEFFGFNCTFGIQLGTMNGGEKSARRGWADLIQRTL